MPPWEEMELEIKRGERHAHAPFRLCLFAQIIEVTLLALRRALDKDGLARLHSVERPRSDLARLIRILTCSRSISLIVPAATSDGSENAPVKSPKRAIAIANRNKDHEINLLTTDWARINRELGAEEDEFPQGGGLGPGSLRHARSTTLRHATVRGLAH